MKVEWKVPVYNADPNLVAAEIGEVGRRPEDVLEIARNPDTELHKCFEWNDSVAAEKYRLSQARHILTILVYKPEKQDTPPLRVYHLDGVTKKYEPVKKFIVNEDSYKALLMQAKSELEALRRKYHTIAELEAVFKAIEAL